MEIRGQKVRIHILPTKEGYKPLNIKEVVEIFNQKSEYFPFMPI